MSRVTADISMSLDGFVTGPDDSPQEPMGRDGHQLHRWLFELSTWRERVGRSGGTRDRDAEIHEETFANVGAYVMGRRMFDHGEQPWGDQPPFGAPVFVVTHTARPTTVKQGGTSFVFVTEGVAAAVERARTAADGRDVLVVGGGSVIRQCLVAGLLDELQVHLVPVLMGDGVRLFERTRGPVPPLRADRVEAPNGVVHLRFDPRPVQPYPVPAGEGTAAGVQQREHHRAGA